MFGALSVASVVAGSALSLSAQRFVARTELLETCAGVLLIGGFGLLGSMLRQFA